MDLRQRGIAHVNILWAIFPMVLFFGALGYAYERHTEVDKSKAAEAAARAQADQLKTVNSAQDELLTALTEILENKGVYKSILQYEINGKTSPEKLKSELATFSASVKIPASIATLPEILNQARTIVQARDQAITSLQSDLTNARKSKSDADTALATVTQNKNGEISQLQDQKRQANLQIERTMGEFTNDLGDARNKIEQGRKDREALKDAAAKKEAELSEKIRLRDARIVNLQDKMKLINSPEQPDGNVLSASESTGLAYIDLGSKDMVKVGMTWRILEPTQAGYRVKGHARITEVDRDRSLVKVTGLVDRMNPVVRGDYVANDLYTPMLKRNIFLLGRFNEPYSKEEIKRILTSMGNKVYDKMSPSVDLVVVGYKPLGEDAPAIVDMPDYQTALNLNMEIVPLQRIRDFLKIVNQ